MPLRRSGIPFGMVVVVVGVAHDDPGGPVGISAHGLKGSLKDWVAISLLSPLFIHCLTFSLGPVFDWGTALKRGTQWPNRWPSETFGETWTSSGTNLFGVFRKLCWQLLEPCGCCLARFNMQRLRVLASEDRSL